MKPLSILPCLLLLLSTGCSDTTSDVDALPIEEPRLPPRSSSSPSSPSSSLADASAGDFVGKRDGGVPDAAQSGDGAPDNVGLPPAPACALDTRTVYFEAGRKIESITAYGQYWSREVFADGSWKNGDGFPTPVRDEAKFVNGPCAGNPGCVLDTRVVYFDSGKKIESITAYGKLHAWTFGSNGAPASLAGYPQLLTSSAALAAGPCAGSATCAMDTRAVWTEGTQKIESMTGGGKLWSYVLGEGGQRAPLPTNNAPLASIPRFADGPCLGHESACVFETRTVYVDVEGTKREEVTARGRMWAWILGSNDSVLAPLADGTPLVDIPRLKEMCP